MSGISGGTARMVIRMPLPASHRRATRVGTGTENLPLSVVGSGDRIRGSAVTVSSSGRGANRGFFGGARYGVGWAKSPSAMSRISDDWGDFAHAVIQGSLTAWATRLHSIAFRAMSRRRRVAHPTARDQCRPLRQINRLRPLVQLDVGTPGIRNERQRDTGLFVLRVGPVQFDAGRFELLDEPLQVRHIEADMIKNPPLGGGLRRIGLVEAQLGARDVGHRRIVAHARL